MKAKNNFFIDSEKPKHKHTTRQSLSKEESILQIGLNFIDEDLFSNQNGYITNHQIRVVQKTFREQQYGHISLLFFFFLLCGILIILGIADNEDAFLAEGICLSIILLLSSIAVVIKWQESKKSWQDSEVASIEGYAGMYINRDHRVVRIGNMEFTVSQSVYEAFRQNERYRVYYTPHSKIILSAEYLGE